MLDLCEDVNNKKGRLNSADVEPTDRWIDAQTNPPPMTDKRGRTSESVLIIRDNGWQDVAFYCYDDEGNYWSSDDEKTMYECEEVTHWQPLPKPPTKRKE